ncbi:hypothetical protein ACFVTZ_13830 [Cellulosimicrobium cellulans]|uniref:hypothetical protein n=1 Tax=Cellulosimicrobium cellulans TaxID=1710 RepID=UPI0036E34472
MSVARRAGWAVVLVLALLGAGTATWCGLGDGGACRAPATLRDLDGRCVRLDTPPGAAAPDARPTGGRFEAPAQGLDVPLSVTSGSDGVLDPPTLTEAFVLDDPGRTTDAGVRPLVVAMHAVRDGRAPGNAFFERGARDPAVTVAPGDALRVDGATYVVEGTEVLAKDAAAVSPEVWGRRTDGARRLVVLTCLQRTGASGAARENLVIHAVLA